VTIALPGEFAAAADGKETFTILHTNDMHASFIGMGPASDYTPFTLNDDSTRGGYARLAGLIAQRKNARNAQGPVLPLDAGDYSMGTAFSAATRETGGELRLIGKMGYDATTFGRPPMSLGANGCNGRKTGARFSATAEIQVRPTGSVLCSVRPFYSVLLDFASLDCFTRLRVCIRSTSSALQSAGRRRNIL
jgi:5'-nucleotidase